MRNLASHHTWRALIQNGCSMRATAQYTFANHCRTHLCCVDQCAYVFSLPQPSSLSWPFLPGLCATAGRSTLTTVLQVTNFVESLLLGSQTILFSPFYPSTFSDLHWEEAFFSCIPSSPPPRGCPSRGLSPDHLSSARYHLDSTISCLRTPSAACNNRNWPSTYFDIGN